MLLASMTRFAAWLLLLVASGLGLAMVAEANNFADQPQPTQERLRSAAWWPTKIVPDQSVYTGSAACAECHKDIYTTQQQSQMAHTLKHAGQGAVTPAELHATYRLGDYRYTLSTGKTGLLMHVSDLQGARTEAEMQWVFGSGDVGQSFLWKEGSDFRESRFNYFAGLKDFAATPGRLHGTPLSIDSAVGRPIASFEAKTCFACHTNNISADLATITPGVGCESCHGPGRAHIQAMQQRASITSTAAKPVHLDAHILNPDDLTPVQQVDLCGSCHSTSWDVRLMGAVGVQTVRFPAYRLEKSHCWNAKGDQRLVCTSCHNPHAPLEKNDIAYDVACLTCHVTKDQPTKDVLHTAAACPVSTTRCISCHMPKVELPEMHHRFTDHNIRIAQNTSTFPD